MTQATVILGQSIAPAGELPTLADRVVLERAVDCFSVHPEVYLVAADDAARRYALAAGASRVDILGDLQTVQAEWVLVGPGSLAEHGDWLPAALAEHHSAALVFDIQDILAVDGNTMLARRDLGSGHRDELVITAPAVLVFSPQLVPTRYVSRFRQRAVGAESPIRIHPHIQSPLQGLAGDWGPVRPRVQIAPEVPSGATTAEDRANSAFGLATDLKNSSDSGQPLQADPATCAAHLRRYLSHHGLLPAALRGSLSELPNLPATESSVPVQPPSDIASTQRSAQIARRVPRRIGEVAPERHRRQPRRVEVSIPPESLTASIARRPRRLGNAAPERQRGPKDLRDEWTS